MVKTFVFFALILTAQAWAIPAPGNFDWRGLYGAYRFENCKLISGKPIWSDSAHLGFVEISNNFGVPNYIEMLRKSIKPSPIALLRPIEFIGQGRLEKKDDTGKVTGITESYTTEDGVYGYMWWNFRDVNIGWASLHLRRDSRGEISYEIQEQHVEDTEINAESCELKQMLIPPAGF